MHAERRALVEDLIGLETAEWETPSLCAGWAVRDVVAHLAATADLSRVGFVREFVRARFSVDRIVERQLARAREQEASASLTALRSAVDYAVSPPLPLITRVIEIVVHGEDIRRPLGINHVYSTTSIAEAVGYLFGDRSPGGKERLKGLALTATDTDFSIGDGPLVKGPAVALLLAASGRVALLDQLSGPGSSQLVNRLLHA
ncbi:maleylpyruvate isomerase family mycothiol-dependent enzyme [Mycolicibacterium sp. YH-1]|nr:maleylpyruvate isomerase family mycothiol-dependent enzyme [Mycolicibacterium sp. YH-1]UNB55858.1 maleylpyruvate isomerase family mycothiol-dependent enzyme [Mycolicibacterium sp. YH-1]